MGWWNSGQSPFIAGAVEDEDDNDTGAGPGGGARFGVLCPVIVETRKASVGGRDERS